MTDVIGVAWFQDESTYRRARASFSDPENLPDSFKDWRTLVGKQCALIRESGNTAIRADIEPEAFLAWCALRGFKANSAGRIAFVRHVVLEYQKTGEGRIVEG